MLSRQRDSNAPCAAATSAWWPQLTEPLGWTTFFVYDSRANVIARTNALGEVTRWAFHGFFNKATNEVNALGWTNHYELDNATGNLLRHSDALGTLVTYTYRTNGLVETSAYANGNVTRLAYDTNGFLAARTDPATNTWQFVVNDVGWKLAEINPFNDTTAYAYDLNGNALQTTDPLNRTFTRQYDANGNLLAQSDGKNIFTRHAYDAANQRIATTNRIGSVWLYTFTSRGKPDRATDPLGNTTTNIYDSANRLIAVSDPLGNTITNQYDANGNSIALFDVLGQRWSKTFDRLNRVTAEADPLGNTRTSTFDAADQLTFLQKYLYGLDPTKLDNDGDTLSDYDELFLFGTNPLSTDTDGDGIPDAWEIQHGLNPRINDAAEIGLAGVSNLQIYQYNLIHTNQLDPRNPFFAPGTSIYEVLNDGQHTNRCYYDRDDRLVGAEYSRGISVAYAYDGNGNLVRQVVLSRAAEGTNGLPALWKFLNGLSVTNSEGTNAAYGDADGDGWSNFQEWKAGSSPTNAASSPNSFGLPGANIASLSLPFTPSSFVLGVGQLDGLGAEEIVIGADGDPGTNINFLLVLTQTSSGWSTQRVDVGTFGITSIAVGQLTNRPAAAIYVGLRQPGGTGRILELLPTGGTWQTNVLAISTNEAAFALGVRGPDLLAALATIDAPSGGSFSAIYSNGWGLRLLDTVMSHRGLGTIGTVDQTNHWPLFLLDSGGIQIGGSDSVSNTLNQGLTASYPLNGDANDASGNGRNGTNYGAMPSFNRYGVANSALTFNGSNSYIRVASQLSTGNPFTWSAWFRPHLSSTNTPASIVNQGNDPGVGGGSPAIYINFLPGHTGLPGTIDFFSYVGPAWYDLYSQARAQWNTNIWYHVVVTSDSEGNIVLYVNGVAENSATGHLFGQIGPNFYIGARAAYADAYFSGEIDEVRVYGRVLTAQEVSRLYEMGVTLPEPAATRTNNWRGCSLGSGFVRTSNVGSIFYAFIDDKNGDGIASIDDDFVIAEYGGGSTNANLLTLSRQPIVSTAIAQSYGLASVNFLNTSNEIFITGEPNGEVLAWTATGVSNPLERQLFSACYVGKAWHALASVKTFDPGEALAGLMVDPTNQRACQVIFWPPQAVLSSPQSGLVETAPAAAVLPSPTPLGSMAVVSVRLWDAEGNASTPFLQYQLANSTSWHNAMLSALDGVSYSPSVRVATLPTGTNHTLTWNAMADLGSDVITNVLLRARAKDFMLVGDWSLPTPFQVNTRQDSNTNGIPDSWELQYFGNLSQAANGDYDGDGFSNLAEYIADTDPTDPESYLRFTGIEAVPGGIRVDWAGGRWSIQYLQQRWNLSDTNDDWLDIFTNPPPTATTGSYANVFGTNRAGFFRIRVQRP